MHRQSHLLHNLTVQVAPHIHRAIAPVNRKQTLQNEAASVLILDVTNVQVHYLIQNLTTMINDHRINDQ